MNDNNRYYDQNEVKNKLHNFQEGKDYFVTPSKEPEVKDYTFYNDRLKSLFGGSNWVPVRVWQEKYDGKDVRYRGHFEEGKDYKYSAQHWNYAPDYQGDRGTEDLPEFVKDAFKGFKNLECTEHSRMQVYGEGGKIGPDGKLRKFWESSWKFQGKGSVRESLGPVNPDLIERPSWDNERELKRRHEELMNKLSSYQKEPQSEERDWKIEMIKNDLAGLEREIEHKNKNSLQAHCGECDKWINPHDGYFVCKEHKTHFCSLECTKPWYRCKMEQVPGDLVKVDLQKENQELRQQLASVQAELAKVVAELKKLGQSNRELEQQQAENERVISTGSVAEVKQQVQKSQALAQKVKAHPVKTKTNEEKQPDNGSHPYLVGGSLLAVGLGVVGVSAWCWKKRRQK